MSEPGDKLPGRYRELATEEPSAELDARILAAARTAVKPRTARWMGPVSIAAVLMLGIGVSLRMQMEEPGIETSVASRSMESGASGRRDAEPPKREPLQPAAPERYAAKEAVAVPTPESKPAAPAPERRQKARAAAPQPEPPREAPRPATREEPNPFADAPVVMQQAPGALAAPSAVRAAPASVAPPPPAAAPSAVPSTAPAPAPAPAAAPPPARAAGSLASADAMSAAPRAKREAEANVLGAQALRKSIAVPDPDPERELERIARLRAAGQDTEADRALEQFKREHPVFRIPDAMWERVRPR